MRWQCTLLQRWLPEYPDGDLPAWGKRWLKSHVAHCPDCRQELAELREVVTAMEATPVADPGPEFWTGFSREMHLKLVQAAQAAPAAAAAPPSRWRRLPYLLGAPVLAVLLVWVAVQLTGPGKPVQNLAMVKRPAAPEMAAVAKRAAAPPAGITAASDVGIDQFVTVSLDEGAALPTAEEVDISGWGLDSELAGMSDHEKEAFLNKMYQREKGGSCIVRFSSCSWG